MMILELQMPCLRIKGTPNQFESVPLLSRVLSSFHLLRQQAVILENPVGLLRCFLDHFGNS
jgi:hypothetical protein